MTVNCGSISDKKSEFSTVLEYEKPDLKKLEQWDENWRTRFNAKRCSIMSIADRFSLFYSLDNTVVQQVLQNLHVGILFSDDLKWSHHISNITKKANCTVGFLQTHHFDDVS